MSKSIMFSVNGKNRNQYTPLTLINQECLIKFTTQSYEIKPMKLK